MQALSSQPSSAGDRAKIRDLLDELERSERTLANKSEKSKGEEK